MKRVMLLLFVAMMATSVCFAKPLFPDSETDKSEVELGVEGIQRICPTGMWDHWTFRDIVYDRESNTVALVIQLRNWKKRDDDKDAQLSENDAREEAVWIVANFKEGYEELMKNPAVRCDGDFMLYLSLGTLFKQMEKDGTTLRIILLKPDYQNQVFGDLPLVLTPEELSLVKPK